MSNSLSNIRQSFRNFDWLLFSGAVILLAISLAAIYSVDLSRGSKLVFSPTQLMAMLLGLFFLLICNFLHTSFYRSIAKLIYLASLLLLIAVLLFGQNIRGTTGWFRIGSFSFQPVEFAKLSLIIFLAFWMEKYGRRFDKWQFIFTSGLIVLLPVILILLQPDFGSAMVLCGIWIGMLFLTGTKKRYLAILATVVLAAVLLGWFFMLADYQKDRILSYVYPDRDPLGSGYNVAQSIIAIGSGQILGRGLGFGSQSQLHFLPEAQTDFIFSVIAEELGFVGGGIVLAVYFLIFWRLLAIAKKANDDFSAYLVLGILLMFFIQTIVNLGAVMGFLPVAGIPLPFLSYGGSSLLISLMLIGIAEGAVRGRSSSLVA